MIQFSLSSFDAGPMAAKDLFEPQKHFAQPFGALTTCSILMKASVMTGVTSKNKSKIPEES